jgi:hypothetical protein
MTLHRMASLLIVSIAASLSACAVATSDEPATETVEQGLQPAKVCPAIAILCLPGYQAKQLPNCRQICVPDNTPSEEPCAVGGCSGELCYDPALDSGMSICLWQPEYACYDTATCERQANGACGWTMTSELSACLSGESI